jgi:D-arginine dehydrogenase
VAIIGGGIAGLSLAAEVAELDGRLSQDAVPKREPLRIVVFEREWTFGYHTTGRSAAAFLESYGSAEIRALTRASRPIIDAIGAATGTTILRARPLVWLARPDQLDRLDTLLAENPTLRQVDVAGAMTLCPALHEPYVAAAAVERGAQDIDVDALYQQYRRRATAAGVTLRSAVGVEAGEWSDGRWRLVTDRGEIVVRHVVNAAGAWADAVARRLGVPPAGLSPLRRTVAIATTDRVAPVWPLVTDVGEEFYFRPEGGGLLISPCDETPSPPTDANAEMEDVALALERVNEATTLQLRRVRTSWAGLRTFASDRNPVLGDDPSQPGFFWFAGQGGYGIQIAPALARLGAYLLLAGVLEPVTVHAPTAPAQITVGGLSFEVPDLGLDRLTPGRERPDGPPPAH